MKTGAAHSDSASGAGGLCKAPPGESSSRRTAGRKMRSPGWMASPQTRQGAVSSARSHCIPAQLAGRACRARGRTRRDGCAARGKAAAGRQRRAATPIGGRSGFAHCLRTPARCGCQGLGGLRVLAGCASACWLVASLQVLFGRVVHSAVGMQVARMRWKGCSPVLQPAFGPDGTQAAGSTLAGFVDLCVLRVCIIVQ